MLIAILIVSAGICGLLVYDIFVSRQYIRDGIMLAYVGFVIFAVLWSEKKRVAEGATGQGEVERNPEGIILEIIRQKGQARRQDLLPHVKMSKSSLVRLLDEMEAEGKIVQVGERKASFYKVPESVSG